MKKIGYLEIFIIFIIILLLALYFLPKILLKAEEKQYATIQANSAMMTSKILSEFSDNKNEKIPSKTAYKLAEEMNKVVKNPIDKTQKAYSINNECTGCIVLSPNDKEKNIILTSKDKKGHLIVRTIIQPPSYVTFNKDLGQ